MEAASPRQLCGRFAFVVADDHPSVALAVRQICENRLGADDDQFVTASSSRDLLQACAAPSALPRIIVLDLVMPGALKRASLVRAVIRADRAARVVVYSADESAFLVDAVVRAGARAYVCKSSPTAALVDAIVAVSEDRPYIDTRIDMRMLDTHPWSTLTESERTILLAFCRGGKAPDIVAATGRSYSTVTTHKYNGLRKLGLRDGGDLLPYLLANGLISQLDEDPGGGGEDPPCAFGNAGRSPR